jgi:predicted dithiol-disulfide oxidoreductase (DUF899 family)
VNQVLALTVSLDESDGVRSVCSSVGLDARIVRSGSETGAGMSMPTLGTQDAWQAARSQLQGKEDALLEARDAVVAERRRLPMVEVERNHAFEGPAGQVGLLDVFEGRRQLLLYRFWFVPGEEPCPGCSQWVRNLGDLEALYAQGVSLAMVSSASFAELDEVRARRGWSVPWYSAIGDDFDAETGYTGDAQINAFLRDGDEVFRTYSTSGRVLETISSHWTLMDLTPLRYR